MPSCPAPRSLITVDPRVNCGEYSRSWPSSSYDSTSIGSPATCSNALTEPRLLTQPRNDAPGSETPDMLRRNRRPRPAIGRTQEGEQVGGLGYGRRRRPQGAWTQLHPEEVTGGLAQRGADGPGARPALRARHGDRDPAPGGLRDRVWRQLRRGRRRRVAAAAREDQGGRHPLDGDVHLVRASLVGCAARDRAARRHLQRAQRGRPVPALQQGRGRGGDRERGWRPRLRRIDAVQHDPPGLRRAAQRRHLLGRRRRPRPLIPRCGRPRARVHAADELVVRSQPAAHGEDPPRQPDPADRQHAGGARRRRRSRGLAGRVTPTIGVLGDVMLGRAVGERLAQVPSEELWAPAIRELCNSCDLVVCNLECCISSRGEPTARIRGKPFFFRGPPEAVASLQAIGVGAVGLANNHALDYEAEALLETLELLAEAGIAVAGAGTAESEARRAAIVEAAGMRVGLVAVSDHPREFAAGTDSPGIAYGDLRHALPDWLTGELARLAGECDRVVAFPHWG